MADLVLLSGLPGVGKTTVADHLATHASDVFARIAFGRLLREAVESRTGVALEHDAFRRTFADLLRAEDFVHANVAARAEADHATAPICLLDSHAVTPTAAGLRVTPDDEQRLRILRFAGLVHISGADAVERVEASGGRDGRRDLRPPEALVAETVQLGVLAVYASACDCPLVVVSGAGPVPEVAERVRSAALSLHGPRA